MPVWTLLACARVPSLDYIESADRESRLPLVVAIHGYGGGPDDLLGLVQSCGLPVRVVAPRGPEPVGDGYSWFSIDRGPTSDPDGIARSADRIAALIRELGRPTVGEPVVTGFSQGGILSFAVAVRHPTLVGTAIPLAGDLPESLFPTTLATDHPVIRAFHGADDTVVPIPRAVVSHLAGWSAELTVFPDTAHTVNAGMRDGLCRAIADAVR
jgi:phospholipase/carboxylesterase